MKIRMLTIAAGPQGSIDAGADADVHPEFARELVGRGFAEALEPFPESAQSVPPDEAPPEAEPTAVQPEAQAAPETAVEPEAAPEPEPTAVEPEADKPSRRKGR